ncbi:prolyl oligopeptidase family serine peptidase [Nannocystis sp.]|uniref:alpha/beta hydrolase n=1 Tax=Nannocystis sp. TaxID=1962667 RepID=UPI00344E57B8
MPARRRSLDRPRRPRPAAARQLPPRLHRHGLPRRHPRRPLGPPAQQAEPPRPRGPAPLGLVQRLSLETQVGPDAPPAFLVHSRRDRKVQFHNSELYYEAMQTAGRPAELHLYDDGRHGVGLAQRNSMPAMRQWPEQMLTWLRGLGMLR